MVDDDSSDDTVRVDPLHDGTIRGVVKHPEEAGSAETALATPAHRPEGGTPIPLPPAPSIAGDTPTIRKPGARNAELPTGEVSTRYAIRHVLGQGGMGEVMLAYDEQIGREVAVKRIRSEHPSPEELSRFLREARVQGRLEHPAVVPVHDLVYDATGKPFFVMKRLTGTDMHVLLGRLRAGDEPDEPATRRKLLRAFADVCLAVEFAHSSSIIHRDLKPANVMLGDFGEVYILDWGVARAVTDGDDSGAPPSSGS